MDEKNIKKALQKGERATLVCKRAKAEVPKSVWETYSAFANTIGGVILLGVEENTKEKSPKKRYQIIGVEDPQKIVSDFWNTINSDKVNQNILNNSDVEIVGMNGMQIVCIQVPQADWRTKPIYLDGNVYKNAWKQAGWDLPELKNKIDLDEVELILPVERVEKSSQKSMQKSSQKNSQKITENSQKSTLKSSQKSMQKSSQKILELIMTSPYITLSEMATLLGMTRNGIDKNIRKLKEQEIIRRVGPDKGGHWEIIEE